MTRISALPHDPGPAGWDAILPDKKVGLTLESNITADWLIVGAGFAGLAAARQLRLLHPTDRIVLLEARQIANGPIGRNSGFMIDLPHVLSSSTYGADIAKDRDQITANRAAISFAQSAVDDFSIDPEAFDPMGKVNGAMTHESSELSGVYANHLTQLGEEHEHLDASQMREMTGSDAYVSGLFTPGTVILQPALFARGMAAGLVRQAVDIFENSPVKALTRSGENWTATTPKGRIEAPRAILAVNGQIERFGHFRKRLLHIYLYASMTHRLDAEQIRAIGGHPKWGITPADPMGSTVRRVSGKGGDRIVIRNGITYDPKLRGSEHHLIRVVEAHARGLSRRFPTLGEPRFEYTWGGALCLSQNDVPAFGEIDRNLYSACCQNGLGTVQGTLSGMLAADLASGETSDLLRHQMGRPTPTRLPPFSGIGAPAVLKWKEWKARSEI